MQPSGNISRVDRRACRKSATRDVGVLPFAHFDSEVGGHATSLPRPPFPSVAERLGGGSQGCRSQHPILDQPACLMRPRRKRFDARKPDFDPCTTMMQRHPADFDPWKKRLRASKAVVGAPNLCLRHVEAWACTFSTICCTRASSCWSDEGKTWNRGTRTSGGASLGFDQPNETLA